MSGESMQPNKRRGQRLTLRTRLALWSGGLLALCCLAAILLIQLAADRIAVGGAPLEGVRQLRDAALLCLGALAVLGAVGSYWLAGAALRPLREAGEVARRIGPDTLGTRLRLGGPPDELRALADAFDGVLDRLERAFERQGRFVADASHELRTPLAALRTNLEVTLADLDATLEDYRATALACERQSARLERLAADLLLLADGDAGRAPADEEVALGPLLEEVLAQLNGTAERAGVELSLGGDPGVTARGDGPLLARAFANLVENAVAYNRPGGAVAVTLGAEDGRATVAVADTGVGILHEDRGRIFERFYRADRSRARRSGGAGLGLAIAGDIARRHGGEIHVESEPGSGSTFIVRLPR